MYDDVVGLVVDWCVVVWMEDWVVCLVVEYDIDVEVVGC